MQRRDETDYFRRKWCESRQYFWKKENIQKLQEREPNYKINKVEPKEPAQEKEVKEEMDVTQGKITIGLDLHLDNEEQKYNAICFDIDGTLTVKGSKLIDDRAIKMIADLLKRKIENCKNSIFYKKFIENKKSNT